MGRDKKFKMIKVVHVLVRAKKKILLLAKIMQSRRNPLSLQPAQSHLLHI